MADDFTKRKLAWLDQVANDRELSAEAFRLAFILASSHLNRQTGEAWPGQETLAASLGLRSARSIKHLVDQLAERGHLAVTVGRGRGHSSRYRPILRTAPSDAVEDAPAQETAATASAESGDGFEEFWLQYPRHVAKGAARRAYQRILARKQATATELVAGALRYAAETADREQRYIKHPATWLNGECWRDEPAGSGNVVLFPRGDTGALAAIAGAKDWLDDGDSS